ncbi:ATP synthase F0 subunit B [Alphaproteobacteria bacterium]|nr:ATP synthase F0 subunit B [Alphaproteobacteria bacterium]
MIAAIFQNPLTFVAVAFLICAIALKKFAWPLIRNLIDQRIEGIQGEIKEANKALQEAKSFLTKEEKRSQELPKSIDTIMEHAQSDIDHQTADIQKDLQHLLHVEKMRQKQCLQHLEDDAKHFLQTQTVKIAIDAARERLSSLSPTEQDQILEATLEKFVKKNPS